MFYIPSLESSSLGPLSNFLTYLHILSETHTTKDSELAFRCCRYGEYFFFSLFRTLLLISVGVFQSLIFSWCPLLLLLSAPPLFFSPYLSPLLLNYILVKLIWIFLVSLFNSWLKHFPVGTEPSRRDSRLFFLLLSRKAYLFAMETTAFLSLPTS